jgi:hemerythrin
MADNLKIVNRAIEEHHTIRGHVKLVGDSISDLEALFSLQKARPDWILSSTEALSEKQGKLHQTISALEEGLKNHFSFEEKLLPPLFGEFLMQALILEHREMKERIDETKSLLANAKLEGLSRRELLAQKAHIQKKVEDILQLLEEHAGKEETILKMLQKALQAKG